MSSQTATAKGVIVFRVGPTHVQLCKLTKNVRRCTRIMSSQTATAKGVIVFRVDPTHVQLCKLNHVRKCTRLSSSMQRARESGDEAMYTCIK